MTGPIVGLVPAAGGGSRFGGASPKQYADLEGQPLLARTLQRLLSGIDFAALYVAVAADDRQHAMALRALSPRITVLDCGGDTRAQTVRNALDAIGERHASGDWMLVHDAARPCVPLEALRRLAGVLVDEKVGALLATPVTDTLKRAGEREPLERGPRVLRTEDRTGLWQAQTPQVFRLGLLREALRLPGSEQATDEAQAIESLAATGACGMPRLVPGSALNIKVTYPADLALAAAIRRFQEPER